MGWASGSFLFEEIITILKEHVPSSARRVKIYEGLIKAFEAEDCDTLEECLGRDKAFDCALAFIREEERG